jgi:hypothetical protein
MSENNEAVKGEEVDHWALFTELPSLEILGSREAWKEPGYQ